MDEQNQLLSQFLIPLAIIIAGIIVAFAIYYSKGGLISQNPTPAKEDPETAKTEPNQNVDAILSLKQDDYVLGNPSAANTIIEYGDFQCPFCGRFYQTAEQELKEKYVKTGKAKFIWRDFAFLGEESLWASEAARCAGEQGKFWEYHDELFENQKGENQGAFLKDNLKKFAKALKLNADSFNNCLDSEKYREKVEKETNEGKALGVNGTPATFVNGEIVIGTQPFSVFQSLLESRSPNGQ